MYIYTHTQMDIYIYSRGYPFPLGEYMYITLYIVCFGFVLINLNFFVERNICKYKEKFVGTTTYNAKEMSN